LLATILPHLRSLLFRQKYGVGVSLEEFI